MTQVCKRCVMDTTDPLIKFDKNGVCNHCSEAKVKLDNGWLPNEKGQELLTSTASRIRNASVKNEYDVIVGVSGGIDSSYLLHLVTKVMNLRPLVVHVDAGWNSEIAVKNIEKLVKKLNLDLFTYVVNWEEIKDLQLSFLNASVANQDTPQDHVFFAKLYDFAVSNKIKYVVTGSNLTSESILPAEWGYTASDSTQIKAIHRKFGTKALKSYPMMSYWQNKVIWPYVKKMEIVRPLNWIYYDKNKAIEFLQENYGWRYYGGKHHESHWTKFFQSYYLPIKFGFDKRKAHLSSMIIADQITREDALAELERPVFEEEDVKKQKSFVAKKLGVSLEELERLIKLPNKTYRDYPNQEKLNKFFINLKKSLRAVVK